jgi:hypothetical protein
MSRFDGARSAFSLLASALRDENDLRVDVERAFEFLLARFNTRIYENRFVVGAVTERIIGAAFKALGQRALTCGVQVTRTDLFVAGTNISIKGVFKPKHKEVRMVNVMGDSKSAAWNEPTIFVLAGIGIGYADPEFLPRATRRVKDAVVLKLPPAIALWDAHPELLVKVAIPFSRDDVEQSDVASRVIADEIFRYGMKRLRPFDDRTPEQ